MLAKRILFFSLLMLTCGSLMAPFEMGSDSILQLLPVFDPLLLLVTCLVILVFTIRRETSIWFLALSILQFSVLLSRNYTSDTKSAYGRDIRVLSLNVQQFENDTANFNRTIRQIKVLDPDVVLLQEFGLYDMWPDVQSVAADFAEGIGMENYYFNPESVDIFGVATFSKGSINDAQTVFHSTPSTNGAHQVVLNTGKQNVVIVNYHLESYNLLPVEAKDEGARITDLLAKRSDQSSRVLEASRTDLPVVLGGDLNSVPGSYIYSEWENYYSNAQSGSNKNLFSTFKLSWMRLDHIWVSSRFGIYDFFLDDSFPSDHKALIVDLSLDP